MAMLLRSLWPKASRSPRELGRLGGRALELVHHLALGHGDPPERDGKAQLLRHELHLHLADADLADEGVGAAEPALGGVGEAEHKTLVAPRQRLEADGARGRERRRLAGQVADRPVRVRGGRGLDQPALAQKVGHAGKRVSRRLGLG
jgi:hypothetical protein